MARRNGAQKNDCKMWHNKELARRGMNGAHRVMGHERKWHEDTKRNGYKERGMNWTQIEGFGTKSNE